MDYVNSIFRTTYYSNYGSTIMDNEVNIDILLFARAREIVGKNFDHLKLTTPIDYKTLFETIVRKYSLQEIQKVIVLSINGEFVSTQDIFHLNEHDEIAVIPPLSGG
ncbi:hypothetical protein WA026_017701 [Henosepilachna vigintioctopunctata]|uniref:MoaD/ThiS family protein n=1 Tax=Henosepilachna vigintioctopunctata TaxID=420089 RepID=A0AAW1U313_9CUCU